MRLTTIAFGMVVCLSTAFLSGCEEMKLANPDDGYSTEYPMSAIEYTIFLNKEVAVVTNVLFTRASMADRVSKGMYKASKELENAQESLSKMEDIVDELTVTMPAKYYDTDGETTLSLVTDARNILRNYVNDLENNNDVESYVEQFKSCYIALGGEANVYYE